MRNIAKLEKLGQKYIRHAAESAIIEFEKYTHGILQEMKCFVITKRVDPVMISSNEWTPCKIEKIKFHPHYEILNADSSGELEFIISVKDNFTGKRKRFSVKKSDIHLE